MKRLTRILTTRWLVTLVGAILIAMLIWLAGPLVAVGDVRILESSTVRLLVVAVLLIAWGAGNLLSQARQARTDAQMVEHLTAPPAAAASARPVAAEEIETLRQRLTEALALLKQSAGKGHGRRYLYQLPWYILIGPPGAGKTTALSNSGLRFPLAGGTDAVKGVGGTRNCDWWFTDEAVLLDTAGRYTTQDSEAAADKAAWLGFLGLLKKFRRRQPISGALVAIGVGDLATMAAAERQVHAATIRRRLNELQVVLGMRFPVYVLFTKADLIAGFVEYFDDLDREAREQVWGVTLPLADKTGNPAVAGFPAGFDSLVQRLNDRLLARIQSEGDVNRRAILFGFPGQLASLKEPLVEFLDEIFRPNRFEGQPLLRGVYFTSGTQEGTPIDRMMGAMAASFGLDRQRVPAFSGQGRSYFLTRLLRGVVFPEAGIASADSAFVRRAAWLRRGAYAVTILAVLAGVGILTASYLGNRQLIAETDRAIADYQAKVAPLATPVIADGDVERPLPALRTIRAVTMAYGVPRSDRPGVLGFGLYQGEKLGSAADVVYRRALERVFLPRIEMRVGSRLQSALASPDELEPVLKVYLMLGGQGPLDKELVRSWLTAQWNADFPGAEREAVRNELAQHVDALLDKPLPEMSLDAQLIASARRIIGQTPLATRTYEAIKQSTAARQIAPWRPIDHAGPGAEQVLARISGKPLTEPVPGLFTPAGYQLAFLPALAEAVARTSRNSWLLGDAPPPAGQPQAGLQHDVLELYADDYTRGWDALLSDLTVVHFRDMSQAADVLNILASPSSPLKALYSAIAAETDPTRPAANSPAGTVAAAGQAVAAKAAAAIGQQLPSSPAGQRIAEHFRLLREFVGSGGTGPAPVDDLVRQLGEVYSQVSQMAQAGAGGAAAPIPPGSPLANLAGTAARLPVSLRAPIAAMATNLMTLRSGSTRSDLDATWRSQVYGFCSKALDNRYPLVRSSTVDVNLDDFARLFKPGGLIDAFVAARIKPFVDTGRSPWKASNDLVIAPDALTQFERAAVIRDLFFPNGASSPVLRWEITPVSVDPSVARAALQIGGNETAFDRGSAAQPVEVSWPDPRSQPVRLTFSPDVANQPSSLTETGAWALFRLVDQGSRQDVPGLSDRVRITMALGNRKAVYELHANSVINALTTKELGSFRCPPHL